MQSESIHTIAVLITCFNRKNETLNCIKHLYESKSAYSRHFEIDVYLTDDGSTDGTSLAVKKHYPEVKNLSGNGNFFWAGGMRNSWNEALKKSYDAFLLLNDDTTMDSSCFGALFETHEFSVKNYGRGGIYIGSIRNPQTQKFTYGGRLLKNKWTFAAEIVLPDGTINECHLGNANIMLVHKTVVQKIGILSKKYIHAKADYDYTLRAYEKKIPVLVCPDYCGSCTLDHAAIKLSEMPLKKRIQYLKSPRGIELSGYMYFMWRFFPWRAPFVFCSLWLKTLIPGLTGIINKMMNR